MALNIATLVFLSLSPAKSELALYRQVYRLNPFKGSFEYTHVGDDPLKYAGLRPYFYLPFTLESSRIEKIEDFNSGMLILSESNIDSPCYKRVIEESNCETLWTDLLYKFRTIPIVRKILTATKYRFQLLLRCE